MPVGPPANHFGFIPDSEIFVTFLEIYLDVREDSSVDYSNGNGKTYLHLRR